MKIMYKIAAISAIMMLSYGGYSQTLNSNRTNYFEKYAAKLPTPDEELSKAFHVKEGGKVKLMFGDFAFNGVVTSSLKRYENLYTVIVKSAGLNNTLLFISKRINHDKTITYGARILNNSSADGFQLKREINGGYTMNKIKTDELIEDF